LQWNGYRRNVSLCGSVQLMCSLFVPKAWEKMLLFLSATFPKH
jgi:hypothetical protein